MAPKKNKNRPRASVTDSGGAASGGAASPDGATVFSNIVAAIDAKKGATPSPAAAAPIQPTAGERALAAATATAHKPSHRPAPPEIIDSHAPWTGRKPKPGATPAPAPIPVATSTTPASTAATGDIKSTPAPAVTATTATAPLSAAIVGESKSVPSSVATAVPSTPARASVSVLRAKSPPRKVLESESALKQTAVASTVLASASAEVDYDSEDDSDEDEAEDGSDSSRDSATKVGYMVVAIGFGVCLWASVQLRIDATNMLAFSKSQAAIGAGADAVAPASNTAAALATALVADRMTAPALLIVMVHLLSHILYCMAQFFGVRKSYSLLSVSIDTVQSITLCLLLPYPFILAFRNHIGGLFFSVAPLWQWVAAVVSAVLAAGIIWRDYYTNRSKPAAAATPAAGASPSDSPATQPVASANGSSRRTVLMVLEVLFLGIAFVLSLFLWRLQK